MVKRIIAIFFIFICASVAWAILGATIFSRTYSSDSNLEGRVVSTWGAPHNQTPPAASIEQLISKKIETFENGKPVVRMAEEKVTTRLP
jgi:hypothetical protein